MPGPKNVFIFRAQDLCLEGEGLGGLGEKGARVPNNVKTSLAFT